MLSGCRGTLRGRRGERRSWKRKKRDYTSWVSFNWNTIYLSLIILLFLRSVIQKLSTKDTKQGLIQHKHTGVRTGIKHYRSLSHRCSSGSASKALFTESRPTNPVQSCLSRRRGCPSGACRAQRQVTSSNRFFVPPPPPSPSNCSMYVHLLPPRPVQLELCTR